LCNTSQLAVVLGVDCIGSSWICIRDENLNEEGWLDYLTHDVLPFCGPNRVLMYDNLRAHVTARATQLIVQSGHTPLARPVHSPWLAPIEFIFGLMEAHLRRISPLVTRAYCRRCVMHAYVAATTPANCAAIFRTSATAACGHPQMPRRAVELEERIFIIKCHRCMH